MEHAMVTSRNLKIIGLCEENHANQGTHPQTFTQVLTISLFVMVSLNHLNICLDLETYYVRCQFLWPSDAYLRQKNRPSLVHIMSCFLFVTHLNQQWKMFLEWYMMTSSNGNIFRVTGHLCGEFTGPRWILHTKASDAELWCLLWSAPE